MAAHRVSDTWVELRSQAAYPTLRNVIGVIDWPDFFLFVVGKTIPLWWIPVHTLTFMLPSAYRVLAAAYLSIILGVILVYARRRRAVPARGAENMIGGNL